MTIIQAILLGIIQGFSEFLPISSSGHLVLVQNWLQIYPPPFYFDIFLHFVSVLVLIIYFRKAIINLKKKDVVFLAIATLPILATGYFLKDYIQDMFHKTLYAGVGLIVTGFLNLWTAKQYRDKEGEGDIRTTHALIIGFAQATAIIPGISRSGSTLFGASIFSLNKKKAFELSFMMGIIAIIIASLAQILFFDINTVATTTVHHWSNYLFGGTTCLIASFFSLNLLKKALNKTSYHWFGWYCVFAGILSLAISFM